MKTEQIEKILNEAPEGAQFYDNVIGRDLYVMINKGVYVWHDWPQCAWMGLPANWSFTVNLVRLDELREILELRRELEGFREVVKAVAHIGVDFGHGEFVLDESHIKKARELLKEKNDE